ncbi:MAG: cupin, partial [Desulfobacteraceae bacterium]|nr:cupin [Desulfobacteraceae bacterium]
LAENDEKIPAETGDILISEIREPHGVESDTKMRIIVTIAPPI